MKNEIISVPISLTEGAVKEIKSLITSQQTEENLHLRIGVKSGGCSGFEYIIGFDDQKENDERFEIDGISIVIQKGHLLYLDGISIDYQNGLNNRGFIFNNPNANETCGCGSSFSA